jgi:GT2 family glycosyltransferase
MKFLVLIPHYGSDDHLKKLLPSINCQVPDKLDDEVTIVPTHYGEVMIVNNNVTNRGFTKACNMGLRYAYDMGFDVAWLLNNDTFVPDLPGTLDALKAEFNDHPSTAIVGFKIVTMDDPDMIHHGGTGDPIPAGVHKVGRVSAGDLEKRTLERWVTGARMAILVSACFEFGLLDEKMVNYYSDSDICYRARDTGFDVVYLPLTIHHAIGQSGAPSQEQQRVMKGDMLRFFSKWVFNRLFEDLNKENFQELTAKPSA